MVLALGCVPHVALSCSGDNPTVAYVIPRSGQLALMTLPVDDAEI